MTQSSTNRCVLFLYEGETEDEFFPALFKKYLTGLKIPITSKNLKGDFNINKKVANAIYNCFNKQKRIKVLYVVVQHDLDGKRNDTESELNIDLIIKEIGDVRLIDIHDLLTIQVLESLFFIDIEGVYNFLKAPKKMRNPSKYKNHENFTDKDLNKLFHDISNARGELKEYKKGKRVENFINHLNIDKIYNKCNELKEAIAFIKGINKRKK